MLAFQLRPDVRRAADPGEGTATCRRCGVRIHILREDRRQGYCFDCYDPSEVRAPAF